MTAHSARPSGRSCSRAPPPTLRGYGMDGFPADRWAVEAGELRRCPAPGSTSWDTFGDFELEMARRARGNSGVMYRVVETAEPAWTTGPEYQILDDALHPDGRDPTTSAAALYDLIAPATNKRLEPVGSFNRGRIVVRDGRVEHWLNGERVVSYDWDDSTVRDWPRASSLTSTDSWLPSPATSRSSTTASRSGVSGSDRWVPDSRAATLAIVAKRDPHDVLGVARGASPTTIKAAWRRLARQHHPDLTGDDPAASRVATA